MKHLPFQLNLSYFTIQDNIFVSSFQRNDRVKSGHKYCTVKLKVLRSFRIVKYPKDRKRKYSWN